MFTDERYSRGETWTSEEHVWTPAPDARDPFLIGGLALGRHEGSQAAAAATGRDWVTVGRRQGAPWAAASICLLADERRASGRPPAPRRSKGGAGGSRNAVVRLRDCGPEACTAGGPRATMIELHQ